MRNAWLFVTVATLAVACGQTGYFRVPAPVCTPGIQVPCACPGGIAGAQACAVDGSAWGACACLWTSSSSSSATSTVGSGGSGGALAPTGGSGGVAGQGGAGGSGGVADAGVDAPVFADAAPDGGPCATWGDVWGILTADCSSNVICHGAGGVGAFKSITLEEDGGAHDGYNAIVSYVLGADPGPAMPYVVPGSPATSGLPCNMILEDPPDSGPTIDGSPNPWGTCGSRMPKGGVHKLSSQQLDTVATWIACGALED